MKTIQKSNLIIQTIKQIIKENKKLKNENGYINVMIELELYNRINILVTDEELLYINCINYNTYRILYTLALIFDI